MKRKSRFLQAPVIGNDNWIADFAATLAPRPYTSREFLYLLGGHLWKTTGGDAQSWGKLATDSPRVSVHADATIALPLLGSALAHIDPPVLARRTKPDFTLASRLMTVDGQPVPSDRFEEVNESAV